MEESLTKNIERNKQKLKRDENTDKQKSEINDGKNTKIISDSIKNCFNGIVEKTPLLEGKDEIFLAKLIEKSKSASKKLKSSEEKVLLSKTLDELIQKNSSEDFLNIKDTNNIPISIKKQGENWLNNIEKNEKKKFGEEEKEYLKKIIEGKIAKNHLIMANQGLTVHLAKKFLNRISIHDSNNYKRLPMDDLIQEANLALIATADKFDYKLGRKFVTYAGKSIWNRLERSTAEQSRNIRLPAYKSEKMLKVKRAINTLEKKLEREATVEEIAEKMGLSVSDIQKILKESKDALSLDDPIANNGDITLGETIYDKKTIPSDYGLLKNEINPSFEKFLRDKSLISPEKSNEMLKKLIPSLKEKEQIVLKKRNGILGEEKLSTIEVGKIIGVSHQRVSQIEKNAKTKLAKLIEEYLKKENSKV